MRCNVTRVLIKQGVVVVVTAFFLLGNEENM